MLCLLLLSTHIQLFNVSPLEYKDVAQILLAIVGLVTLFFGLWQYRNGLVLKRSEQFLKMRERYIDNPDFIKLFHLLDVDDEQLRYVSYKEKLKLLGFYEEIALMKNSRLIKKEVAFYMFAYYAIRIWKSSNFWFLDDSNKRFNKESIYWILFKNFVTEMIKFEKDFEKRKNKVKFKL